MSTEPSIEVLPADVASQIAAGEVVERPLSVLKEIIENALDAGARTITVSIDGGGLSRVAVTDDGHGMSSENAQKSVLPHATSKIRQAEDLQSIGTFGFRGEALASIGSVSRLRITTRTAEAEMGTEVLVEAGRDAVVKPAGCAPGTTVSVEDLFYNTPARRKFLRTPQTEYSACADTLMRLALSRPDVKFVLRKDGKTTRELLRRDDVAQRAAEIWPDETLARMEGSHKQTHVLALLGPPERARAGGQSLALYVNGRHVKDRVLLRAVAQSYGSTLESGRYPSGALLLEVPPEDVDVNVHPQKAEVRFAKQGEVFEAIHHVIRAGLASAPWARVATQASPMAETLVVPAVVPTSKPLEIGPSDFWSGRFTGGPTVEPQPETASPVATPIATTTDAWGLAPPQQFVATPPPEPKTYTLPGILPERVSDSQTGATAGEFASLRFVGQVRKTFLLCEGDQGLVVLDQHAAAERVTFHRLRQQYASRSLAMQPMLVPETLEVTTMDVARIEQSREELLRMGVEFAVLGETTVAIKALPALLRRAEPRKLARDLLAEMGQHGNEFSRAVDLVLATMACHGSVRAGDVVTEPEARALLASMDEAEFAGHCPHGRPVVWNVRWSELERRVGR